MRPELGVRGMGKAMAPSSDTPLGAPFSTGRKCILVVEDELLIRLIVSDELRDAGYDVIEAFNADEALTVLRSLVRVDLVISDVRMPGSLDGLGLLAEVRATWVRTNRPELEVRLAGGVEMAAETAAELCESGQRPSERCRRASAYARSASSLPRHNDSRDRSHRRHGADAPLVCVS